MATTGTQTKAPKLYFYDWNKKKYSSKIILNCIHQVFWVNLFITVYLKIYETSLMESQTRQSRW